MLKELGVVHITNSKYTLVNDDVIFFSKTDNSFLVKIVTFKENIWVEFVFWTSERDRKARIWLEVRGGKIPHLIRKRQHNQSVRITETELILNVKKMIVIVALRQSRLALSNFFYHFLPGSVSGIKMGLSRLKSRYLKGRGYGCVPLLTIDSLPRIELDKY